MKPSKILERSKAYLPAMEPKTKTPKLNKLYAGVLSSRKNLNNPFSASKQERVIPMNVLNEMVGVPK